LHGAIRKESVDIEEKGLRCTTRVVMHLNIMPHVSPTTDPSSPGWDRSRSVILGTDSLLRSSLHIAVCRASDIQGGGWDPMLPYSKGKEAPQNLISAEDQKNPITPPTRDRESPPEPVVH